jgi:hypothetical protein
LIIFNGMDQILFSLTRSSPSLLSIAGGERSAADFFSITFGGVPMLFADAAILGLDPDQDDIDMLELVALSLGETAETKLLEKAGAEIPEPSTLTLFGTGTLGLLGYGWRRRKRAG